MAEHLTSNRQERERTRKDRTTMNRSTDRMDRKWARRALVGLLTAALLVGVSSGVAVAAPVAPDQSESSPSGQSGSESGSGSAQSGSSSAQDRAQARAEQARARDAAAAAAQRAARAQQRAAEAAQRGRASWESHGSPHKMIIVRPTSVDSLTEGAISRRTPRTGGVITLASLDALVPSGWITASNGTAQLAATVVLTPGVTLDIGGAGLTTLQLLGGPTAADAAAVYTGSGRLNVHDVTLTSLDPASGQPVAPGPGRPFVHMAAGGRLDATDATFSDLGTPATEPHDRAGVSFGAGSTGSLVRTTVLRNSTGVRLRETNGVRLEGLTVAESASDGLMLQGDQGTALIGIRAERNNENGVQVSGPSSARPITGVSTSGNGKFGLAVVSQDAPQITNIVTQADGVGGLDLSGGSNPVVSNFSAVDQPIGVLTHVSSTKVTLGQLRISGGGRGLVVEKTTDGLALTGSTIERTQTGVSIGGKHVELRDVLVDDSQSGIRVERGAGGITGTALSVTGGQDGIVLGSRHQRRGAARPGDQWGREQRGADLESERADPRWPDQ